MGGATFFEEEENDVTVLMTEDGDVMTSYLETKELTYDSKMTEGEQNKTVSANVYRQYIQADHAIQLTAIVHDRPEEHEKPYKKEDFTFNDRRFLTWSSSDDKIATVNEYGQVSFTGGSGEVYFILNVSNGGLEEYQYYLVTDIIKVEAGKTPYLLIPKTSREREVLQNEATAVYYASNLTERNGADDSSVKTTFTLTVYDYDDVNVIGDVVAPKEGANSVYTTSVTSPAEVKNESGATEYKSVSSIEIPAGILSDVSVITGGQTKADPSYVTIVSSTDNNATGENAKLSAFGLLYVKPAPATVELKRLESYAVLDDGLPEVSFTVGNYQQGAEVYYTVQRTGDSEPARTDVNAASGTVVLPEMSAGSFKDIFAVTVYAKNNNQQTVSVDSMSLTVYRHDALDLVVTAAKEGEIGGTTGGKTEGNTVDQYGVTYGDDKLVLDNTEYVHELMERLMEDGSKLTLSDLQNDVNLQAVISINYGDYVWGMLSDQIAWESSNNDVVTVDYKQGGIYSDVRSYTYQSYVPATDFIAVGHDATDEKTETVTIKATHVASGLSSDIEVEVTRLDEKFYIFQFIPKVTTEVTYYTTDARRNRVEKTVNTNANGVLAVYEEYGIISDVYAKSTKGEDEYIGIYYNELINSGEQDVAALQVYPCNTLNLHMISVADIYIRDVNGQPYANKEVTLRGGVYKNDLYCPDAMFATNMTASQAAVQDGKVDFKVRTDDNGKARIKMDSKTFYIEDRGEVLTPSDELTYVFELRFGGSYLPTVITIDATSESEFKTQTAVAAHQLVSSSAGSEIPAVIEQEYRQYDKKNKPVAYTTDVYDYTGALGINGEFPKSTIKSTSVYTSVEIPVLTEETADDSKYIGWASFPETLDYTTTRTVMTGIDGMEKYQSKATEPVMLDDLTKMNDSVSLYMYPFSSILLGQSFYTMSRDSFGCTYEAQTDVYNGVTYETGAYIYKYLANNASFRPVANIYVNGKLSGTTAARFTVLNSADQVDPVGKDADINQMADDLSSLIHTRVSAESMIRQAGKDDNLLEFGFEILSDLMGTYGVSVENDGVDVQVFPTTDPRRFLIMASMADLDGSNKTVVTYNKDTVLTDASKLVNTSVNESMESTSMDLAYYGYIRAEAVLGKGGKWDLNVLGGTIKTPTINIGKSWINNFFVGPIPVTITFKVGVATGGHLEFANVENYIDTLINNYVMAYIYAFAGVGIDATIVALKIGIMGQVGVRVDINSLVYHEKNGSGATVKNHLTGTKVSLTGQVGLELVVDLLAITYKKVLVGVKFDKTLSENDVYSEINDRWRATTGNNPVKLTAVGGEQVEVMSFANGLTTFAVTSSEIRDRDYLGEFERSWLDDSVGLMCLNEGSDNYVADLQTNAYPNANPVYTDDGQIMMYVSDLDVRTSALSAVAWADRSGLGTVDKGTIEDYQYYLRKNTYYDTDKKVDEDTAIVLVNDKCTRDTAVFKFKDGEDTETEYTVSPIYNENTKISCLRLDAPTLGESSLNASGTNGNYFAAWVSSMEMPEKEMGTQTDDSDLSMTINGAEITAAVYDDTGSSWNLYRLTDNNIGDLAPVVASSGNRAIVAWRRVSSSSTDLDFDVDNLLQYRIWNGTEWSEEQTAYNGTAGTVTALQTAMLPSGESLIVYTVKTGDDENSTETYYTLIGNDGAVKTTVRMSNNDTPDTNVQVSAVKRGEAYSFLLAWFAQYDTDGDGALDKNDIRIADVNADGSMDASFIESISGSDTLNITENFRLAGSAAGDIGDLAIVWREPADIGDTESEVGDILNAVKFYEKNGTQGVTTVRNVAQMKDDNRNVTINHFDAYVDESGIVQAAILGSNYANTFSSTAATVMYEGDLLDIMSEEPETVMLTGYAGIVGKSYSVSEPNFVLDDVTPGFAIPVQFTLTNTGTETINNITLSLDGDEVKTLSDIALLPGKSITVTYQYEVPEENIHDVNYELLVTDDDFTSEDNTGVIRLNVPDIGIKEMKLTEESGGQRTVTFRLNNEANIPLAGSGKTAVIAYYTDSSMDEVYKISEEEINSEKYSLIDIGVYDFSKTFDVNNVWFDDLTEDGELPDDGVQLFAKVWLKENGDEVMTEQETDNNSEGITVYGLLSKNADDIISSANFKNISVPSMVLSADGSSISVSVQNNSLDKTVEPQNMFVNVLDANGFVIGTAIVSGARPSTVSLGKEEKKNLTFTLTMNEGHTADEITEMYFGFEQDVFESFRNTMVEGINALNTIADIASSAATALVKAAVEIAAVNYDPTKTLEANKKVVSDLFNAAAVEARKDSMAVNGIKLSELTDQDAADAIAERIAQNSYLVAAVTEANGKPVTDTLGNSALSGTAAGTVEVSDEMRRAMKLDPTKGEYGYVEFATDENGVQFKFFPEIKKDAQTGDTTVKLISYEVNVVPHSVTDFLGTALDKKLTSLNSAITFKMPIFEEGYKYADVYHNGAYYNQYEVQEEMNRETGEIERYILVSSKNFSPYRVNLTNTKYYRSNPNTTAQG